MADSPTTILVVEDDELLLGSVVQVLQDAGYNVLQARDGKSGLEIALKNRPALILTDNMMPVMTGVEMVEQLRQDEWGKKEPVILMTSVYSGETLNDSLQAGVTDFVVKSDFSVDKVVALVQGRLKPEDQ